MRLSTNVICVLLVVSAGVVQGRNQPDPGNKKQVKPQPPFNEDYMTFAQMEEYLSKLPTRFSTVTVSSIGKSVEDRDLWLVKISSSGGPKKTAVWIEGGLHAREWTSPSSCFIAIERLASTYDPKDGFEYYIVPESNPDGYEYSRTNNRLWRKNRAVNADNPGCRGVDLNRNWDYQYGVGTSDNPCSEIFKGPKAFSEPETKALSDAMIAVNQTNHIDIVLAVHCYGGLVLYPWGWTNVPISDAANLQAGGDAFKNGVLQVSETDFIVENSAAGLYFASGATDDWSKAVLKSSYVYTIELRAGKGNSFSPKATEIVPIADEFYAGLQGLLKYYKNNARK